MSATVYKSREFDIRVDTISGRRYLMIHDHEIETFAYIWFPKGFQVVYMEDRDRLIFRYIGRGNRHFRTTIVIRKMVNYIYLFKTYRRLLRKVFTANKNIYDEPVLSNTTILFRPVDGNPPLIRKCKTTPKYYVYNPITRKREYVCSSSEPNKEELLQLASDRIMEECDKYRITYKSVSSTLTVELDEGAE